MTWSRDGATLIHHGPGTKVEVDVRENSVETLRELLNGIEEEHAEE